AESYLVVEDSAAARKLILARHPGEAYILGDSNYPNNPIDNLSLIANSPDNPSGMKQWEEEMRREVKSQNGAVEIYALGRVFESKTFTGAVIRVRGSKAEISLYEDPAWRSYRQLTPVELEELKSFTARQEVEDLGPENVTWDRNYSSSGHLSYEYLR